MEEFRELVAEIDDIRPELVELIYLPIDAEAPADSRLHHPVSTWMPCARRLRNAPNSGCAQGGGQGWAGHHHRRPVRWAERVVPAGWRRPGGDDQGGDRSRAGHPGRERDHHLR